MLTFNLLLKDAGIDPKEVYLVRHQDTRANRQSVYDLYKRAPLLFENYQRLQGRDCFGRRPIIASFIAAPSDRTLFVGLYSNHGYEEPPATLRECPLTGRPLRSTDIFYRLEPDLRLDEFKERLTIEWGPGYRSWIQNADSKESGDKKIVELQKTIKEDPFPGYREFRWDISDIHSIWPSWQQALRQSNGVYLQTCKDCGKQYVGKADGEEGFFGRFCNYAANGHGGNEGMKKHKTSGYFVTILEALATPTEGEIDRLESLWKNKLGSRIWGLNEN